VSQSGGSGCWKLEDAKDMDQETLYASVKNLWYIALLTCACDTIPPDEPLNIRYVCI